jgi:hypothetical protein
VETLFSSFLLFFLSGHSTNISKINGRIEEKEIRKKTLPQAMNPKLGHEVPFSFSYWWPSLGIHAKRQALTVPTIL